jgi:KEOPS complex subunit Cgi121
MRTVGLSVTVADVEDFLGTLSSVTETTECLVQTVDARYVVSPDHLETAVDRAARATRREDTIARDPAVEVLLYAAGCRQITEAMSMGVDAGTDRPVVAVVVSDFPDDPFGTDDREAAAEAALRDRFEDGPAVGAATDVDRVREFFSVSEAELAATDADLPDLVLERVALLVVEK